jgi:hypothetical protein
LEGSCTALGFRVLLFSSEFLALNICFIPVNIKDNVLGKLYQELFAPFVGKHYKVPKLGIVLDGCALSSAVLFSALLLCYSESRKGLNLINTASSVVISTFPNNPEGQKEFFPEILAVDSDESSCAVGLP